jgi:hypothetical protein
MKYLVFLDDFFFKHNGRCQLHKLYMSHLIVWVLILVRLSHIDRLKYP